MKKLIDADALKAWMAQFTEYAGYETAYHFEAQLARYIDAMPDAGCARATSSISQYCPIAEEAGREVEGLRAKVAELEAAYFVLECCKEAEHARACAAEARIRELEAAAKPEGEVKP